MQIREGLCHYLLAIVILFGAPSAAFATEISQGNMRLTLPGNWELRPGAAILTAVSQTHPNTVVLVSVPTEMTAEHIVAYLNRGINGMEQERQVVRRFPEQPQAGFTASGHGFAFQSVASRGVQGDGRYAAYFTFSVGARFQTVILLSADQSAYQTVMRQLSPNLENIRFELPEPAPTPNTTGTRYRFFNYSMFHPTDWEHDDTPYANQVAFWPEHMNGFDGIARYFRFAAELQAQNSVSMLASLKGFLINRGGFKLESFRRDHPEDDEFPKVYRTFEGRLSDGRIYAGLIMWQNLDDGQYLAGGVIVNGPNCSLVIGAGIVLDILSQRPREQGQAYTTYVTRELPRVLAGVRFDNSRIQRRESIEQWLIQKRTLRHFSESSSNLDDYSAFYYGSNRVEWDFFPENRASFNVERRSSFFIDSSFGWGDPSWGSGYLTNNAGGDRAIFAVYGDGQTDYIIMHHPHGVSTFHPVVIGERFSIDGFRDG